MKQQEDAKLESEAQDKKFQEVLQQIPRISCHDSDDPGLVNRNLQDPNGDVAEGMGVVLLTEALLRELSWNFLNFVVVICHHGSFMQINISCITKSLLVNESSLLPFTWMKKP